MKRAISSSKNMKTSRMKNPERNKIKTSLNNTLAKDSKNIKRTRRKRKRDIWRNLTKKGTTSKRMILVDCALTSKKKPRRTQMKNQKSTQALSLKINSKKVSMILVRAMEINV
jgi:hypothetical protein